MEDNEAAVQVAALREKVAGMEKRFDDFCQDNTTAHGALRAEVMGLVAAELAGIKTSVQLVRTDITTTMAQLWRLVFVLISILAGASMVALGVREIPKIIGG